MYPDYEFYRAVFRGTEDEEVIMPFLRAAADIIRACICTCISGAESERAFLCAVCAQGEHMLMNEGITSARIGDFSFSVKAVPICSRAVSLLESGGLLYRSLRG